MGTSAVKLVTGSTAQSTRILGGIGFAAGVVPNAYLPAIRALCPDATSVPDPACSPQQAFYNTIANFFNGTAAASLVPRLCDAATVSRFPTLAGGTRTGAATLNYLEVYNGDITAITSTAQVNTGVGASRSYSGQDLLNLASRGLARISEQPLAVPLRPAR